MDRRNDPCEMVGVHESVLHHGVGGCIITPKATIPSYPLKRSTFVAGWKLALPLEVSAYQVCQAHRPCSSREIVFGSTHSFPGWCGRERRWNRQRLTFEVGNRLAFEWVLSWWIPRDQIFWR